MKNSALIAVGALLIGSAGGYLAGSSGKEQQPEADQATRPGKGASRLTASAGGRGTSARTGSKSGDLRSILNEPGQTNRIMSLIEFYGGLDPSEFEAEARKLQGLPMSQRMLAMNLLFARWAETDPESALAESRRIGFPEMFMARAGVLQGWAASNPESLAKQYSENPGEFRMRGPGGRGGGGGGETVSVIAGEWAKQNPKAALEWTRTLEGGESSDAIEGIFREVSQQDPQAAASLAASLSGDERLNAYRSIAESWAIQDWSAADSWISSLPAEEQQAARIQAVESLANVNPQKAATEAMRLPAGEDRDGLVADVSRDWAREDPSAALNWLTTNGSESAQEESVDRVIGSLAREDAAAAREWIDVQPAGEVRDSAVRGYISGNRDGEPNETIALAESITDDRDRERTVTRVAFQWMRDDTAAATSYLQSSTALSDESKDRMLQMAERMNSGESIGGRGDFGGGRRGGRGGR